MNHTGTITIETPRLILRRFEEKDTQEMFNNWASDPRVSKFMTWDYHKNIEETRTIINMWINSYSNLDSYVWVMVLKKADFGDEEVIGSISVVKIIEKCGLIEFGYCLGFNYWNKGYMTEALTHLIKYFFEVVGAIRIQATHDENNHGSGRVMAKSGLLYESKAIGAGYNNQGICNMITYSLMDYQYFQSIKKIDENIRIASLNDLQLVTNLLTVIYQTPYDQLKHEIQQLLISNNNYFFIYQDIAIAHLSIRTDYVNGKQYDLPCGFLEGIYVKEENRKKGIAKQLIKVIESWLKTHGYKELLSDCLLDNLDSYLFHKSIGFKEVERTIAFQKELTNNNK